MDTELELSHTKSRKKKPTSQSKLLSTKQTNSNSYSWAIKKSNDRRYSCQLCKHQHEKITSNINRICLCKIIEIISFRRHTITVAQLLFWMLCTTIFVFAILNITTDIDIESLLFGIHSGLWTGMFYALTILFSLRYPFYWRLGIFHIGFDRQMVYHRICAVLAIISCITHIIDWNWVYTTTESQTGWICYGFSILIVAFSHQCFRRKYYNTIFVYSHWIFIIGFVITGWFHNAILIKVGTAMVALDVILRIADNTIRKVEIENIQLLDYNRVVKIEFHKKYFSYSAGQYVFVRFPKLGFFEFHPFSLSSHPDQDIITLYIKKIGASGGWVDRLIEYVKENNNNSKDWFKNITLNVEGPHGYLSLNRRLIEYEYVIFIGGGIGVTPLDSLFNQLMSDLINYDETKASYDKEIVNVRQINFIFSTRSRTLITEFATRNKAWNVAKPSITISLPTLSKKSITLEDGDTLSLKLEDGDYMTKLKENITLSRKHILSDQKYDPSHTSHTSHTSRMNRDMTNIAVDTLNIRNSTHITRVKNKSLRKQYETAYPFIHFERPNVQQIINDAVLQTKAENICIICSGPMSLMNDCKKWSGTFGIDFHHEMFLW